MRSQTNASLSLWTHLQGDGTSHHVIIPFTSQDGSSVEDDSAVISDTTYPTQVPTLFTVMPSPAPTRTNKKPVGREKGGMMMNNNDLDTDTSIEEVLQENSEDNIISIPDVSEDEVSVANTGICIIQENGLTGDTNATTKSISIGTHKTAYHSRARAIHPSD